MRIVVQKYGGSSVADLDRLSRVAARITSTRQAGPAVVVVVSAMGNTTDELLALARKVSAVPDRRELDMLVSVGERISMALLAMALRERGIPARSLTGSQSGIVTDEAHANAKVVEVRPDRIRAILEQGEVAIVAGFQGVSRAREITTLGRGGSDTTAVVLAAALGAESCEILSDVDGVWSADPRVVPDAVKLDTMTLDEALALARGGAKVLFEDAVRYARDHGVTLVAGSTFGPGSGTRLVSGAIPRVGAVAVTGDAELVRLQVPPGDAAGFGRIRLAGGRVRRIVGDDVYVDRRNAHGGLPADATPVAVASAVGTALGEDPERVARGHRALAAAAIAVEASGSSGDQAWFAVPRAQLDDAVRRLHATLVETG